MEEKALFVGIDAGGTKTKLHAAHGAAEAMLTLTGGAANLQRAGVDGAARVLSELISQAVQRTDSVGPVYVCAGVAGAGRETDQRALADRITALLLREHGDRRVVVNVVHDAAIALEAAFGGSSGIVVIAGTGSVGFGRTPDGDVERVGGWGYLLGDEGSGNTIGIRGIRAVCAALDGGPDTLLRSMVAEKFGMASIDAIIDRVYGEGWPCQNAAPLVLEASEAGDRVAHEILEDEALRLAEQVLWLVHRRPDIHKRIALFGGVAGVRPYADILSSALRQLLPEHAVAQSNVAPAEGALRLAYKLAAGSSTRA